MPAITIAHELQASAYSKKEQIMGLISEKLQLTTFQKKIAEYMKVHIPHSSDHMKVHTVKFY
jgi:hypothetical protein